jgi:beta-glucanase (GH16 family)
VLNRWYDRQRIRPQTDAAPASKPGFSFTGLVLCFVACCDPEIDRKAKMQPDPSHNPPNRSGTEPELSLGHAPGSSAGFVEEKAELQRVLSHAEISRSASLVRFLSFICNKYFEGQAVEIREYTIAVEALGRKESSFDSRVDPIVRVTARALRKKLGEFYESEGKDHLLQIELPLGHYVPEFIHRSERVTGSLAPEAVDSEPLDSSLADSVSVSNDPKPPFFERGSKSWLGIAWKIAAVALGISAVFAGGYLLGRHAEGPSVVNKEALKWGDPVWSDEFDGAAQQLPDPSKWTYDTGNSGWGDGEIQAYCSPAGGGARECNPRRPNAFLDGAGHLVLRAEKTPDGVWTSARLTTRSLKDFQYGRIEARLKLPVGTGLWPSFWMLGSSFPTVGWPGAGSFDFVENVGLASRGNGLGPGMIRATVHGPRYYGANGLWHDFKLPNGARVDDGSFHTYGAIWSPGMIQFYFDDPANIFFVVDAGDVPEGGEWVFDHPFFLIMNLAVGGDWPGNPDATTANPSELLVDYIRVYKTPTVPAPSILWQPVQIKSGSAVASMINLSERDNAGRVYLSCSTEPATVACTLATPIANFSDTLSQQDTLTLSTASFTNNGRVVAPPGHYKLTITATTISGDRSQLSVPFEVVKGD